MRKKHLLVLLLLSIILSSCKKDKEHINLKSISITDKAYQINYKKLKEVKIESISKGFPTLKGIASKEYLYLSFTNKKGDYEIWKYDLDLSIIDKFKIKYGQGPDECISPIIIGGTEAEIMVYDGRTKRYYIYDQDFRARINIESRLWGNTMYYGYNYKPEKKIAVLALWKPENNIINIDFHIYIRRINNKKFKDEIVYRGNLEMFNKKNMYIVGEPYHFKIIGNYLYLLKLDEYRLIKMDLAGQVVKTIKVNNLPDKKFSRKELTEWIKELSILNPEEFTYPEKLWPACWLIEILDGIAVGRRENYNPKKASDWLKADYFDLNLNFRGRIKLPWFYFWNEPKAGQEYSESILKFINKRLFLIERREIEDDEEFYLTSWQVK